MTIISYSPSIIRIYLCTAIRCPALEAPDNGIVEYSIREVLIDTFSFGAEANFSCSFGFALIGEPVSVCVGNGSSSIGVFDTEAPVCKRKTVKDIYVIIKF